MEEQEFNPETLGLPPNFYLTNYTELKGWGCKVPQQKLQQYLEHLDTPSIMLDSPDCSIIPVQNNSFLISTTDFFYPSVADPFIQGQIACCNVLSDLYSLGVSRCDNMLMILGVSRQMSEDEKEIVTTTMIKGFNHTATQAGTKVTGGQTVQNPWPIIGGVAMSVVAQGEFIRPCSAKVGDKLILTKPIGTQLAVNLYQWMNTRPANFEKLNPQPSRQYVLRTFNLASRSMITLNKTAAELMIKYQAKGSTDITGFGVKGHTQNLVSIQHEEVDFIIHSLPVIAGVHQYDKQVVNFGLLEGRSPETSGGLFIILAPEIVDQFLNEFREIEGTDAWVVGDVVQGTRQSNILEEVNVIEV